MLEEALQIAEKRREVKVIGGRKKYSQLNAEFQRIERRDKKTIEWETLQENWRYQAKISCKYGYNKGQKW